MKEIEIQTMIKTIRVVKAAVKRTFSEDEWKVFVSEHELRKLHLSTKTEQHVYKDKEDGGDNQEDKPAGAMGILKNLMKNRGKEKVKAPIFPQDGQKNEILEQD